MPLNSQPNAFFHSIHENTTFVFSSSDYCARACRGKEHGKNMADINVEYFYQDIAKILSILYASFPSKTAIYVDEVSGADDPDEYGLHTGRYTACFYAMLWLQEEGYLRYADTIRQDGIDQATLTRKAFLKLSAVAATIYTEPVHDAEKNQEEADEAGLSPSLLEDRMLVINQLRRTLKNRSSIATGKVIQHILN